MRLRNSALLIALGFLLLWTVGLAGQNPPATQPPPPSGPPPSSQPTSSQPSSPTPATQAPQGAPPLSSRPSGQAGAGAQSGQTPGTQPQGQAPEGENNGVFVFKKQVEEVILHATVYDNKLHMVTNLDRNAFAVYEDGVAQAITSFRREDIPVAVGIVIDNSGSMRDKRPAVNQAALNFVRSSNPQDEVFIVNFNDEYYLDQDFTASIPQLKEALEKIDSRGGTALYDAVVASADHLKKNARREKKVLLVVTDGEDNASRESLEQAVKRLQAENGPTVYTIGLLGNEKQRRARRALATMAEDTGGVSFFPKDLGEVDAITQEVAHDVRNQYTIGYKPTRPQSQGGYRSLKVEAHAKGYKTLQVRTRTGYYAGTARASF